MSRFECASMSTISLKQLERDQLLAVGLLARPVVVQILGEHLPGLCQRLFDVVLADHPVEVHRDLLVVELLADDVVSVLKKAGLKK